MAIDPRIPMLYDYYEEVYDGVLVNNLDINEDINSVIAKIKGRYTDKNYLTYLGKDMTKIDDCYTLSVLDIKGKIYKTLNNTRYSVLLDSNNTMVTDELTAGITMYNDGGFIGSPTQEIVGYGDTDYRIFGYVNSLGRKIKTYSFIHEKDFKHVGRYGKDDIIARVLVDGTEFIQGYIVESIGDGIVRSDTVHAINMVSGLIYEGELEGTLVKKRLRNKTEDIIYVSELREFVMQRTIRHKLNSSKATHLMLFRC